MELKDSGNIFEREAIKDLLEQVKTLKSKEGYLFAGIPRYLGLFGRDSLISAWQLLNYDASIARNTLQILARCQGKKIDHETGEEPGKILHEFYPKGTPDDWWNQHKAKYEWLKRGKPVYMSHDSTLLFLIVAGKYLEKTNDKDFIKSIFPNIERAIEWVVHYADPDCDGFLEYNNESGVGLIHQSWKNSTIDTLGIKPPVAIVEIQGYAYLAMITAAKIADVLGKKAVWAQNLRVRANELKKKFNESFWMPEKNFFCLALDGQHRQLKEITSNPGHLLFTGIVDESKISPTIRCLFMPDMWTPYGIRTHSELEKNFDPLSYQRGSIWPFDNWMIAQGLKVLGRGKEYQKIKNAIIAAYRELGFMPEYYYISGGKLVAGDRSCNPQAWSAGALLNFLEK